MRVAHHLQKMTEQQFVETAFPSLKKLLFVQTTFPLPQKLQALMFCVLSWGGGASLSG